MTMYDYLSQLPDTNAFREGLEFALNFWQPRNRYIELVREMLEGRNSIAAPANTSYKIKTIHTYSLASIINEKAARFTHMPTIQVVPEDEEDTSISFANNLEKAINIAFGEMERRSDGDVWSRLILDALILDEGVERIERAPAAFWPEVMAMKDGQLTAILENTITEKLKKQYGLPLRSVYVPLENFFPIYEGTTIVESYEVELRSLRSVLRNPLFQNKDTLMQYSPNTAEGLRTQVSLV